MPSNNNPYSQAASSYAASNHEISGRKLEVAVLLKAATRMDILAKRMKDGEGVRVQEVGDIMDDNRKIWQLFLENMLDDNSGIPQDIRNNISNLALFVFKRTNEVYATYDPNKIQVLIDINRNIANGLSKNVSGEAAATKDETSPAPTSIDSNI